MTTFKLNNPVHLLLTLATGGVLTFAATNIYAQVTSNTIFACVRNATGLVRVVGEGTNCLPNETALSWNQNNGGGGGFGAFMTNQLNDLNLATGDYTGKNMSGANFSGSFMGDTQMSRADMSNADFTDSIFEPHSAKEVNFTNANFTNANMSNAQIENSVFTGAIWNNTICPDGTNSDDHGNTCEGHLSL